ncbi:hypothetical protein Q4Q34_07800 [Flavivirga abyssicola]|uniref:hypothetical protein n=1 Tax=Flavivirga abyssicola TaxID=3063533 RepID=UPI0026DEAA86|nr:hypothetical protein [Flavivirga sp. MEBiC07777]WVK14929.1 hypothetical protein Q4Q34_07800 [Flavivirga sp. MEBiC07777]
MKTTILNIILFLSFNVALSQTKTQVTVSNGDGWYRIIEGSWQGSDMIKISEISGSNIATNLTMHVSLMAYGQGGSINIVNNSFYNSNHVKEIRGGTSNGKYVLDVYLEGVNNPTNMSITTNIITPLTTPIYNPIDNITGKITISGKIIGTQSTRYPIYFSNNVGIGTVNTGGWELAVNGKIRAKEIKVETGWADFVFENTYNLPTLKDVEQHIKEKGHLKDIPSAKEVAENGIFLGEMDSKLLQKIEELTLYTINQEKRIESLESKNETLILLVEKLLEKASEE